LVDVFAAAVAALPGRITLEAGDGTLPFLVE
jgi:hypothetical protein